MSDVIIKSLLMNVVAAIAGTYAIRYILKEDFKTYLTAWLFIIVVTFITLNIWLVYISVAIAAAFIAPKEPEQKVYYYLALLPILPVLFVKNLPFPGINYLLQLNPPRVLVLVALLPIFLKLRGEGKKFLESKLDWSVLLFCVVEALLYFRGTTVTNGLRNCIYVFLDKWVPYIVLSRMVTNFSLALRSIMYSGVILMILGMLESRMAIKTFSHILPHLGVKFNPLAFFAQKRDFGMRVTASLGGPIPFSYFLALNGLITYFWLSQHTTKKKIVWGILAGFSIAILFTGSRGGLFAMLAGISMIFFYKVIARQWFFMVSSLLGVISYFIAFGLDQLRVIFGKIDEEGTFTYRIDLIKNSLKVVEKYFFFGNPKFIDDPALEPSRQGQGIIDIVNTFLQVVLEFGVVGLVCFVAMFYFASKGVLMRAVREGGLKTDTGRIGIMFFAMFVCTLVLIATCSAVGFIPLYYLVLIALASAYIRKNDELPFKGAEDTDESTAPESRAL